MQEEVVSNTSEKKVRAIGRYPEYIVFSGWLALQTEMFRYYKNQHGMHPDKNIFPKK